MRNSVVAIVCISVLCFPAMSRAQGQNYGPQFSDNASSSFLGDDGGPREVLERRTPSIWHRAQKRNPADQLAFARALRDRGELPRAGKQYLALIHKWHDSDEAVTAGLELAEVLDKRGYIEESFDEYQYVLENFVRGYDYRDVLQKQMNLAKSVLDRKTHVFWMIPTSGNLERALPLLERVALNGPGSSFAAEANYDVGWIQEKLEEYELAVEAYETVRHVYPSSEYATDAEFRKGKCLYLIARENRRDEFSAQLARAHLRKILETYPGHEMAGVTAGYLREMEGRLAQVCYSRAAFYDRRGKHPMSALLAYRDFLNKFPKSGMAGKASERVAALEAQVGEDPSASDVR